MSMMTDRKCIGPNLISVTVYFLVRMSVLFKGYCVPEQFLLLLSQTFPIVRDELRLFCKNDNKRWTPYI